MSPLRFRARKTIRLGPLFWTFTTRGLSSWGIRIGRIMHNLRRGTTSVDTPGPGSVQFTPRRRGRRR